MRIFPKFIFSRETITRTTDGWNKINKEASEEIEHTLIVYREGFEDGKKAVSDDRWHDARKELPPLSDNGVEYIVCIIRDNGKKKVQPAMWYKNEWWDGCAPRKNIVGWQPLPDPPDFEEGE